MFSLLQRCRFEWERRFCKYTLRENVMIEELLNVDAFMDILGTNLGNDMTDSVQQRFFTQLFLISETMIHKSISDFLL